MLQSIGQSMVQPSTTTPQHFQRSMPTPVHVEQPSMPTSSHDQVLLRQSGFLDGSLHTPTNKQELLLVNHLMSTALIIPIAGTVTNTSPAVNIKSPITFL